jgi:hypothetical protein
MDGARESGPVGTAVSHGSRTMTYVPAMAGRSPRKQKAGRSGLHAYAYPLRIFRLRQSRRGIRAPPAWTEARVAAHASRAATGSRALVRAPSGGLARCARPATIRRAIVARRTHRSRSATRSQPDAYLPRARAHAVRRSTTVCRGTQPCPRARAVGRVWRGSCRRRSTPLPRAVRAVSLSTRCRASEPSPVSRSGGRDG